jgi:hypothetical protein
MSEGKYRLVTLLYQAAKIQGGSEDCMPSFRRLTFQAAAAAQNREEGGAKSDTT